MFSLQEIQSYINTTHPSLTAFLNQTAGTITAMSSFAVFPESLPARLARFDDAQPIRIERSEDFYKAYYRSKSGDVEDHSFGSQTGLWKILDAALQGKHAHYYYALIPSAPATGTIDELLDRYDHPYEFYREVHRTPADDWESLLHPLDIEDVMFESVATRNTCRDSPNEYYQIVYTCPSCTRTLKLVTEYTADTPGLPPTTTDHAADYVYCPECETPDIPRSHILSPQEVFTPDE